MVTPFAGTSLLNGDTGEGYICSRLTCAYTCAQVRVCTRAHVYGASSRASPVSPVSPVSPPGSFSSGSGLVTPGPQVSPNLGNKHILNGARRRLAPIPHRIQQEAEQIAAGAVLARAVALTVHAQYLLQEAQVLA